MSNSGWIDTHAHLADLDNECLNKSISASIENNVHTIINSATDINSAKAISTQTKGNPNLFGAAGISPFDTPNVEHNWENELKDILKEPDFIALGEIGLDTTNPTYPDIKIQKEIFLKQLDIAAELEIPVVVHSRGSEEEVLNYLQLKKISKAIFHCYTGPSDLIEQITQKGYYISYSGIVTFKKTPLDEQVKATPLSKLFIETDSPYLAPHPNRGKKNEPAFVSLVGEKIASLKGVSSEELQKTIIENFTNLFGIAPSK